ncbi:MAG: hydroxymethylglutaryl-CoA lyase [Betaproteobacteria bacterium]|nr:MAG: hydroxymethylglutaryl-CoA lyase [Betaproteobacteria bacterium]
MDAVEVTISEVGPRDGLQNTKSFMPTAAKKAWISAEAAAGVHEIEVCSFVPAKLIPQFVDAEEVLAHANSVDGLTAVVLVPNLKGCERAIGAGARRITVPVSVSEAHSMSNVRKTTAQAIEEFVRMADLVRSQPKGKRPQLVGACSTAFGCSLQGVVAEQDVLRVALALRAAGADSISLADTVGYANPEQVKRLFGSVRKAIGEDFAIEAHFHNTRGLGLANALAAYEAGVRNFDSTLGGLGGCPWAPGASGNVVTEDLVFMFESMGVRTGVDINKLIEVRNTVFAALPDAELYGHISKAGLPKGFRPLSLAA